MPLSIDARFKDLIAQLNCFAPDLASQGGGRQAVVDPAPTSGIWPQAIEKVKVHGPDIQARVDSLLQQQGLALPNWQPPAAMQHPDHATRKNPLSYLKLQDGSRVFMTQTLANGSFGKFRLGLWASPSHPNGGQLVALKELRLSHWKHYVTAPNPHRRTETTSVKEAADELKHLTAPYSPLPVHGVVEHRGKLYVAMPVLGDSLHSITKQALDLGAGSPTQLGLLALHIAYDGAEQLLPIHAAGVVHRDIKPANMMHGPGGRVTLVDLGLAARGTQERPAYDLAGTPGFLPPEVLAGIGSMPKSDAWSLMVTALTVALGRDIFPISSKDPEANAITRSYSIFQRGLPRDSQGHIDVADAIASTEPIWPQLFADLARISPKLADFTLNEGLNPSVHGRANVARIKSVVHAWLTEAGIDPAQGSQILHQIAQSDNSRLLPQKQLEAFVQVMTGQPARVLAT